MEIEDKRQGYLDYFYVALGLVLGVIGNLWVYFLSRFLETTWDLQTLHWTMVFVISSLFLFLFLYLFIYRYVWRGLKERMPRLLRYSRVVKKIKITDEKGNARITWLYEGKNIGKGRISRIRHILRYQKQALEEDEIEVFIDGKKIGSQLKTYKLLGSIPQDEDETRFESLLDLDLGTEAVEPGQKFSCRIEIPYKETYSAAFTNGKDFTYYRAHSPTDEIVIKIFPPTNCIVNAYTQEGMCCEAKDGHMIPDLAETKRVNDDEPLKKQDNGLIWKINKPFINYEYRITFTIAKPK